MTTDTPMVELCARSIAASLGRNPDECVHGSGGTGIESVCHMRLWETYAPTARAVLECLRTPTPEMVEASIQTEDQLFRKQANGTDDYTLEDIHRLNFTAMIDRALLPSKGDTE